MVRSLSHELCFMQLPMNAEPLPGRAAAASLVFFPAFCYTGKFGPSGALVQESLEVGGEDAERTPPARCWHLEQLGGRIARTGERSKCSGAYYL